jgi:opacity protein-like surface antigen
VENSRAMKATFLPLAAILALGLMSPALAQDVAPELEAKFQQTMTAATLTGRWTSIKDGALGEEKPEKYTIVSVAKTGGDNWVINARMRYQQQDIVAPIPVQVKWAGDTAVIIVSNLTVPGGGTYSARVLIHDGTYAGTWSGGNHGGLLNGLITKTAEAKP